MITIKVTHQDIKKGIPGTVDKCPIALAYKHKYKQYVCVDSDEIVSSRGIYQPIDRINTLKLKKFVLDFDKKKSVRPMTIKLNKILL